MELYSFESLKENKTFEELLEMEKQEEKKLSENLNISEDDKLDMIFTNANLQVIRLVKEYKILEVKFEFEYRNKFFK